MAKETKGDIGSLITFLSAKDPNKSLFHPQKKFAFSKNRILKIIDTIKYESNVVDEDMYKQLSTYLKDANKEVVTIDDFRDAFKKEHIQKESGIYTILQMTQEDFEKIASDFVNDFISKLEGLREKRGGNAFIGLKKNTNDKLLDGLNSNIHTFQNIDEVKVALKELSDKLKNLKGKADKNKRTREKTIFIQQIKDFIRNNALSRDECFDLLNFKIPLYNAHTVWQAMEQGLVKKLGYESLYHHNSGVMLFRKENNTYDVIDSTTHQLMMSSDIEEYNVSKAGDQLLQYGEIAVRKGNERSIFKEGKKAPKR